MSKNIGFSMKYAKQVATDFNKNIPDAEAYAQREDHWPRNPKTSVIGKCQFTHQWIVVIQKKPQSGGVK